ncbi:MAG TPA: hypothetical protein VFO36_03855, partial [Nitrospiraceae bacterium]|nr:hypothetical protein [Nitrospiraceae bacterium]
AYARRALIALELATQGANGIQGSTVRDEPLDVELPNKDALAASLADDPDVLKRVFRSRGGLVQPCDCNRADGSAPGHLKDAPP